MHPHCETNVGMDQCCLELMCARAEELGGRGARDYISMVGIIGPALAENVPQRAIQIFGAKGVSQDTPIPSVWSLARVMRIPDGPDEVHMSQLAKLTMRQLIPPAV